MDQVDAERLLARLGVPAQGQLLRVADFPPSSFEDTCDGSTKVHARSESETGLAVANTRPPPIASGTAPRANPTGHLPDQLTAG